jgi:hypothetical protein
MDIASSISPDGERDQRQVTGTARIQYRPNDTQLAVSDPQQKNYFLYIGSLHAQAFEMTVPTKRTMFFLT